MKKRIVMFLSAAMAATGVWADEWTDPDTGYTWTYTVNGDTAEIFCYSEIMGSGGVAISPMPTGALKIPATFGDKPMTGIGGGAFYECTGLTSVTIPDGVMSIGAGAFFECSGLTSVTIPDSVTEIKYRAFYGCTRLTSVMIPDGVTKIEDYAFSGCSGINSFGVTSGNANYKEVSDLLLTKDGETLVAVPASLTSVTIPDGVTEIRCGAFIDPANLTSVTIPGSMKSIANFTGLIGGESFHDYGGLTSVTILNGVTRIEGAVFSGCTNLTSVTIPDSMTSIGTGAFYGCSESLFDTATIPGVSLVDGWVVGYTGALSGDLDLTGVRGIGEGAFKGCSGLTSVTIPDGVTNIGWETFSGCGSLTSVTIPASVTSIEYKAFRLTQLATVHVASGDVDRVKNLLMSSGCDVSHVTFVEDVSPDPVTPGYEVIEATDIIASYEAPKVVTLQGAVYDGGDVFGVVELKLGKVSKGKSKVSGSFTGLDGKKITLKAVNVTGVNGTSPVTVSLEVKGHGTMTVAIGGTQFAGSMGRYHVQSANVGGDWTRADARVYVDGALGERALPEGTVAELLPDGEPVVAAGGKWKFAKAASVKWAKPKKGAALPERYDEASGKGLVVDASAGKTNLSAMKLTYTPKKGTFKGSFKVYALEGAGKATKLKKYTVKVSGVVVGGVGYGTATCKKPVVSWAVTVK